MQAYRQGLRYPRYLILTYTWYSTNWWVGTEKEDEELGCSTADRESLLPYTLGPQQFEFIDDNSVVADTGIVSLVK